jgi:hypothetical protein
MNASVVRGEMESSGFILRVKLEREIKVIVPKSVAAK